MRNVVKGIVCVALWGGLTGCAGRPEADSGRKKNAAKPDFAAIVKDAQTTTGFVTVHRKKGDVFWEIPPAMIGAPFFFKAALEEGAGAGGLLTGMPLGPADVASFEKVDEERLQLVLRNIRNTAAPESPLARAVAKGFAHSVMATLKVEATHPRTGNVLVDMKPVFLSDVTGLTARINRHAAKDAPYVLDAGGSAVSWIKVFPENVEVAARLHFVSKKEGPFRDVPDARSLPLGVRYSVSRIPADAGYRPRLWDDRIGYFTVAVRDFSRDDPRSPDRHYICRWDLRKKDPAAPLSPPVTPIRFWIENTTPREYRQAVREGILAWNAAFARAGFSDAIEAVEQPDDADWDPADVRYSVVRWIAARESPFAGMGPARVHPATGQILDADVLIHGETVRNIRNYHRMVVEPLARDGAGREEGVLGGCGYAAGLLREAGWALDVGVARGEIDPTAPAPKAFVDAYVRSVVCHEVGHVLGLRHNFRGSRILPFEALHGGAAAPAAPLSGSVMDYLPPNIALRGRPQGDYFMSGVGPYDLWAVEYGYRPIDAADPDGERPALQRIASRAPEPELAFATDEDADALDPTAARFDLSADAIAFCAHRFALAREMIAGIGAFHRPGETFADYRDVLDRFFGTWRSVVPMAVRHVGGHVIHRYHAGDADDVPPVRLVPRETQRRALDLLAEHVFSDRPFVFPPALLGLLAPDRRTPEPLDYFPTQQVTEIRRLALDLLLAPDRLRRLQESVLRAADPSGALSLPDLFAWMTETLWTEVGRADAAISAARREAQWLHLERLAALAALPSRAGAASSGDLLPEEARVLAWASLADLAERIAARQAGPPLDPASRAHLSRAAARIRAVLEPADARGR